MLTISSHFVRALMRNADSSGVDFNECLTEFGISAEVLQSPLGLVHAGQFVSLTQRAWQLFDDEYWGLTDCRCKPGHFALMVRYVYQFNTLQALLKEMCRFYNTTREDVSLCCDVEGDEVNFRVTLSHPEKDIDHFLTEFLMVIFHRFICWVTGKRIALTRACFSHSEPAHHNLYGLLFPCDRSFESPFNGFSFSVKTLELPLIRGWSEVKEFLKDAPADLLIKPASDDRFCTKIKTILLEQQRLGKGFSDFNFMAAKLCVSPPTLRRKLQAENNSYQQIKDAIRCDLAIDKLLNESLAVAEIGQQLGFVEPASFTRAFKQWTGVSPAEYRLNLKS